MAVQPLFYDLLKKLNEVKETTDKIENTRLTDDEKEFHSHRRGMDVYAVKEIVEEFKATKIDSAKTAHGFVFGPERHPPFTNAEMARWTLRELQNIADKMEIDNIPRTATASTYIMLIHGDPTNVVAPFTTTLTRAGLSCPPYSLLRLRILAVLFPPKFGFLCRALGVQPTMADTLNGILHRVLNSDGNQYQYGDVMPKASPFQRAVNWLDNQLRARLAEYKEEVAARLANRAAISPAPPVTDEVELNDLLAAQWRVRADRLYYHSREPTTNASRDCYRAYLRARGQTARPYNPVFQVELPIAIRIEDS